MESEDVPLPHLETFSKAAESNSFTAAAQALGLTQAAVSQRIQSLEKALGESLFQRLIAYPLVLRESGSGLRHCFEKSLERAGRSPAPLRVALELGSNEAIKEAVLRGVGLAILSAYAVQKEAAAGRLHALEVRDLHCDRDMFIVQDRRRVRPPPARLFLHFLETHPLPDSPP